jgi:hypothetical protein
MYLCKAQYKPLKRAKCMHFTILVLRKQGYIIFLATYKEVYGFVIWKKIITVKPRFKGPAF